MKTCPVDPLGLRNIQLEASEKLLTIGITGLWQPSVGPEVHPSCQSCASQECVASNALKTAFHALEDTDEGLRVQCLSMTGMTY